MHASFASLPAATATCNPDFTALFTARSFAGDGPPPRDMFTTAPLYPAREARVFTSRAIQFKAEIDEDDEPCPLLSSTLMETICAFFATPYLRDAIVPATCVPWPL